MPVNDWFDEFAVALQARCGRTDWPDFRNEFGSEFWRDFEREMVRIGATMDQADEAASIVAGQGEVWADKIRPMVVAEVKRLQALAAPPVAAIEDARHASATCQDCNGSGFAVRYVHADILGLLGTGRGDWFSPGSRFAMYCSCSLGQHFLAAAAKPGQPSPSSIDRYPPLRREPQPWSESPDGLDNRHCYRPDDWSDEMGRPYAQSHPTRTVADLRALCHAFKAPTASPAASASCRRSDRRLAPTEAASGHPDAFQEPTLRRPDLAPAASDPVIARDLARLGPRRPTPAPPILDLDDPAANF